ncbi:enoyl-CoA hydratase [Shewanella gelidii]|uniref:Enoyl-CoA hydratase domain-containing protein 3, mitochondrial n=1 Tax=Shewanella gelidii TaxID=1642821 RepID=A0A917N8K6_9GAMM|nr:enoyl-CoA hydratase [Shewanella gelidii]MCL1099227.1 enoyl-CoA hydratase [Shewanella gelidii]GGI76607.1 enoyl-CoA hydratase [Shewanella gelidii]
MLGNRGGNKEIKRNVSGFRQVNVEHLNGVDWLIMNHPQSRNALSCGMIADLSNALQQANDNPKVKVIVIAANGHVFSAGHDLKEASGRKNLKGSSQQETVNTMLDTCAKLMLSLNQSPKPIIACVQGAATAAGCQLVSMCDLAIASQDAGFCTPGVNIGIFCSTPLVGIGRNIASKHAMEMALTGDMFSAQDAFRFGLVNRVVPSVELKQQTQSLAQKIASKSALGIASGKPAFYLQRDLPTKDALTFASRCMMEAMLSAECEEGVDAFFEKRSANWAELS